ncbi:hypothetical protein INT47_007341, partial [Mucor saturninus]
PDAIYPRLWQEAYNALRFVPYSIIIFFYDIYSHSVLGQPKRSTWDMTTTLIIALLHAVRYAFQESSISFWRDFLRIPYQLSSTDRYHSASFFAQKLSLPGILQEFDSHEDGTRKINAHWLLPLQRVENEDDNIILYLHGGGYCMKDWQAYFTISQSLSEYLNQNIFAVSYSLAPETRFPGALADAVQAYFHLISMYKVKPSQIVIVGDSAGGGLAMSLLIYLRDHCYQLPKASILLSIKPWVDLTYGHQSWLKAEMYDTLPPRPHINALVNPARLYLGPEQYRRLSRHPYASPLFASNYDNLPPILIQSGGSETMTDEVRSFADKFAECKNTMSKHEEYEDMIHDFQAYPIKKARVAFLNMQKWIQFDIKQPKELYCAKKETVK